MKSYSVCHIGKYLFIIGGDGTLLLQLPYAAAIKLLSKIAEKRKNNA